MPDLFSMFLFAGVSLASAAIAVVLTGRLADGRAGRAASARTGPVFADAPRRYEFREGYLLSDLDPNDAFLAGDADRSTAYDRLADMLKPISAEAPARFTALARRGEAFLLAGRFGTDAVSIGGRLEGDRLVISVGPSATGAGRQVVDAATLAALRTEAEVLRAGLDLGHALCWREDADGGIGWANGPYLEMAERIASLSGSAMAWPPPRLFGADLDPPPEPGTLRRCRIGPVNSADRPRAAGAGPFWFEIAVRPIADGGRICSAVPIDRLVAAETELRNFVQTLSKTFAQLPEGLAIFDRRRELVLFNPALVTLSTLEPAFLSSRPSLPAFLDALRDRQRMPEPKDYRSWRDEFARLQVDAEAGTCQELWTLPGGQSFRVTGRPHPDGAVAFIFEDITSEVSLTRRFRADLGLYQALIDDLPGAVAVFSRDGLLLRANAGYAALWGEPIETLVGTQSLVEATRSWQRRCRPSTIWGDIRHIVGESTERAGWSEEVHLQGGERLAIRVAPLAGGTFAVWFAAVGRDLASDPGNYARPEQPDRLHDVAEAPRAFLPRPPPEG